MCFSNCASGPSLTWWVYRLYSRKVTRWPSNNTSFLHLLLTIHQVQYFYQFYFMSDHTVPGKSLSCISRETHFIAEVSYKTLLRSYISKWIVSSSTFNSGIWKLSTLLFILRIMIFPQNSWLHPTPNSFQCFSYADFKGNDELAWFYISQHLWVFV